MIRSKLVQKLFFSLLCLVVTILLFQLVMQSAALEFLHTYRYKHQHHIDFQKKIDYYSELYSHNAASHTAELSFHNSATIVLNDQLEILNPTFFDLLDYIIIATPDGLKKVLIDDLVDEYGYLIAEEAPIHIGDTVECEGVFIRGTQTFQFTSFSYRNNKYINSLYIDEINQNNSSVFMPLETVQGTVEEIHFANKAENNLVHNSNYLYQLILHELNLKIVPEKESQLDTQFDDSLYASSTNEYIHILIDTIQIDPEKNIYLVSLTTFKSLNRASSTVNEYYIFLLFVQLILIVFLSYLYTKWLSRPLILLSKQAQLIADQHFDSRIIVNSKDELGVLSTNLTRMSLQLSNTIKSLKDTNQQLDIETKKRKHSEVRTRNLLINLSHEFKSPLTIISGFLDAASSAHSNEDLNHYYNIIFNEVYRLDSLIKETLELSKYEDGIYQLNVAPASIKALVESTLQSFEVDIRKKGIRVDCKIHEVHVECDPFKIRQVLVNVIGNALKYSPENEMLSITTSIHSNVLKASIHNTGINLSESELYDIWDRYHQDTTPGKGHFSSTGLGLSIVKCILDLHGSEYHIDNHHTGIQFVFTLPISD